MKMMPSPLKHSLSNTLNEIRKVAQSAPLGQKYPQLIAVSKRQPLARITELLEYGHRVYGENRIQEAQSRWPELKSQYSDVELHYIGHLQSNKAPDVVELFDYIHSVDRPSVAKALSKAMKQANKPVPCFIQVNTGEEPQKSGILVNEFPDFLKQCQHEWDLPIIGLMCLPPQGVNPVPHFAFLRKLAQEHGLKELSMGMSGDWKEAVRMGASYIRLGTALFGEREV